MTEINKRLWRVKLKWYHEGTSGDIYVFVIADAVADAVRLALLSMHGDYSEESVYGVDLISESVVMEKA